MCEWRHENCGRRVGHDRRRCGIVNDDARGFAANRRFDAGAGSSRVIGGSAHHDCASQRSGELRQPHASRDEERSGDNACSDEDRGNPLSNLLSHEFRLDSEASGNVGGGDYSRVEHWSVCRGDSSLVVLLVERRVGDEDGSPECGQPARLAGGVQWMEDVSRVLLSLPRRGSDGQ